MFGFQDSLFDPATLESLPQIPFDAVVMGAGVAGLTFALDLPQSWNVAVLTKGLLGESNTRYAQGGLSAAVGDDDSPILHIQDTHTAGAGLCDAEAVEALIEGAPEAVEWLVSIGANFDRDPETGQILLGREAAHSRRRVLHAGGDATGAEIERALVAELRERTNVTVFTHAFALELVIEDGRATGLVAALGAGDELTRLVAQVVVVAAGGAGQLWATTSNPLGASADGLAMAIRTGVAIADAEFVQFHPTVFDDSTSDPFLVSEAVRGEGAYLRNQNGNRFMVEQHELAELAPRDVVARGIHRALQSGANAAVYLDLRHLDPEAMRLRFPSISRELASRGLDLATDLIPIKPAAHYYIGGLAAGPDGKTSVPGLLALGEASCTGVHGANRLASNSLLEGLVFGKVAADTAAVEYQPAGGPSDQEIAAFDIDWQQLWTAELVAARDEIQMIMSRDVAVVRNRDGLMRALTDLAAVYEHLDSIDTGNRAGWQVRNMAISASAVTTAALQREESRGGHFRSDFPQPNPALEQQHQWWGGLAGDQWSFGSLETARQMPGEAV